MVVCPQLFLPEMVVCPQLFAYRRSFRFELDPADLREIRLAANGGYALGNDRFKSEIAAMLGRRVKRLRDRELPRPPS